MATVTSQEWVSQLSWPSKAKTLAKIIKKENLFLGGGLKPDGVSLVYTTQDGANHGEELRREREQENNFMVSLTWVQ